MFGPCWAEPGRGYCRPPLSVGLTGKKCIFMSTRTANICARQPNGRHGLVWNLTMPRRTCRRNVQSLGHAPVVILEPALQTAKVISFRGVGRGRQTRPDAICGRALRFECSRSMQNDVRRSKRQGMPFCPSAIARSSLRINCHRNSFVLATQNRYACIAMWHYEKRCFEVRDLVGSRYHCCRFGVGNPIIFVTKHPEAQELRPDLSVYFREVTDVIKVRLTHPPQGGPRVRW